MPVVSVGLPVWNGENYLREAIESILGQTMDSLELIIADNASEDGTEDICREYAKADPRVLYFRHDSNLGAAPNYNFTLDQARGEYFLWTAHDDVRDHRFLESALNQYDRVPDAASVFPMAVRIDDSGERLGSLPRPGTLTSPVPWKRFRAAITCRHPGVVVFGLIHRSLLESTGRHGAYPGADRVLAAELALLGSLVEIPDVMFFNRDHPHRYVRLRDSGGRNAQSLWWDASRSGRVDAPALRRFAAYLRAVRESGFTPTERARCYSALAFASLDNSAGVLKEIAGDVVRTAVGRVRSRA